MSEHYSFGHPAAPCAFCGGDTHGRAMLGSDEIALCWRRGCIEDWEEENGV